MHGMNENETYEPQGPDAHDAAPRKTGLIVALIALVVVLAGGLFLYNTLTQAGSGSASGSHAAGGTAATSASAGAAASTSAAENVSSAGTGAEATRGDAMWLADYNATVFTEDDVALLLTQIADGKPLVVNYWATWCPYCVQEMGDFQQLYAEYGDRVEFAFVDCVDGHRETVSDGAEWLRANGYDLPAYYDTDQDAVYTFGIANLPTTMIVGASGEILAITPGKINIDLMRDALDAVLDAQGM